MNLKLKITAKPNTETIADHVARIRNLQWQIDELNNRIQTSRDAITDLLQDCPDQKWADDYGYAMLTAGSTRVSYDHKSLDVLRESDPDKYGYLSTYRKETPVKGSLRVK